jgi:hypothetical protein
MHAKEKKGYRATSPVGRIAIMITALCRQATISTAPTINAPQIAAQPTVSKKRIAKIDLSTPALPKKEGRFSKLDT